MNFEWKNWCRFCGNGKSNVKFECTIDIEYYFKISDRSPKICESCSLNLNNFQDLLQKTEKANRLFRELQNERDLDNFTINEIREKFDLGILEIKQEFNEENCEFDIKEISFSGDAGWQCDDFPDSPTEASNFELKQEITEEEVRPKRKSIRKPSKRTKNSNESESEGDPSYTPNFEDDEKERPKKKGRKKKEVTEKPGKSDKRKKSMIEKLIPNHCHICNSDFPSFMFLENHCKKEHQCRPAVSCICSLVLNNYSTYNKHKKSCLGKFSAKYICDLCPKLYYSKQTLEAHMDLKHKSTSRRHICQTCGKEFPILNRLKDHEATHVPDELRKTHECPHCHKMFSKRHIKTHIRQVHELISASYICELCSKAFKTNARLQSHLVVHQKTCEFECDLCSKKFRTAYMLKVHSKIHRPPKYFCEIDGCSKGFRSLGTKKRHTIYIHSDERPFPCPDITCPKRFKFQKDAEIHYNHHHLRNFTHVCPVCDERFYSAQVRTDHVRDNHPEEYPQYHEKYRFMSEKNRILYPEYN